MAPLVVRDLPSSPPERLLRSLAEDFLTLMLRPSSLALFRLIVAEAARFPELVADSYAVGTGSMLAPLAEYLALATANGRRRIADQTLSDQPFLARQPGPLHT